MLRTVTLSLAALSLSAPAPGLAQQIEEDGPVEYAPGSTGPITAPLATIVDNAKKLGDGQSTENCCSRERTIVDCLKVW
ncbi:hypothetical protein ABLN87_20840 [Ruegeria sp. SCPT10]|uniref:hypothetical protein n=1 Tax=Ruegeria sp. SCP10 TaxID=3141377 RepID=UPI003339B0F3